MRLLPSNITGHKYCALFVHKVFPWCCGVINWVLELEWETLMIKIQNYSLFLAVHNSSIGLIVPWSDQTNNQSLHNTTGWPLRLVTFETLDQTFWWQFLKTTFNDNFWWQFLMTIFDANFDDNFDDYFWWQVLMTIFGWQFFLGLIFNLWLVIFETLITILTIENLVSWQSLLPDN